MALARDTHIPIWYLIQCFVLDRTLPSGLRWRERPLAHFPDKRMWKTWNTKWAGKPAGSLGNQGYWIVILKTYRASPIKRIASSTR
jgi:hypothetical protein